MKKIFQVMFVCMLMLICVSSVYAAEAADITTVASGTCGENATWVLDSEGTLTISGTGEIIISTDPHISPPWYSQRDSITNVIINNGITDIGRWAFLQCAKLVSVSLPDSITSISGNVFEECTSLTNINIPGSVTSIGAGAFLECSSLESITIPDSVTSIGNSAFRYCTSLTSVTIPANVTEIGTSAFSQCDSLEEIVVDSKNQYFISDNGILFDIDKLRLIQYPIGKKDISYEIPASVRLVWSGALYNCYNLKNITVNDSSQSYSSVDGNLFNKNKTMLVQYAVGKSDASYTVPSGVTSIGDQAFLGCRFLKSIILPDSLINISRFSFSGCYSLTSITIPDGTVSIGARAFDECTSLTSISLPDSITSIEAYAFYGCSSLASIAIPDGVTSIGDRTFWECTSLTSITIPDSVTSIGNYAFYRCSSLTNVNIPSGVTSIGEFLFGECSSLESITIPNSVTSIGSGAFQGCSSLKSITIPDSIISIGNVAFRRCTALTSATILGKATTIGDGIFYGCSSLASVTISNDITSIGTHAFYECTSLTNITIPNSISSIEKKAFYGCTSLESITIPDSVTTIGYEAFRDCRLSNVALPNNVESIDDYAFFGNELTSVTIPKSVTELYKSSFPADTMLYVYKDSYAHNFVADNEILHSVISLEAFGENSACVRVMNEENTKCDVTLLSGIDALDYNEMGFMVTVGSVTTNYDVKTLYKALSVLNENGTRVSVLPAEFGEKAKYIFAITLPFGKENSEETLVWRPYAIDLNGKSIYGKESTINPIFK